MKVEVFEDEISCTRYIPFKLELNGDSYGGVLIESVENAGGFLVEADYEIEWTSEKPPLNESDVIEKILQHLKTE